jgi:hypothetical protein
MRMRRTAATSVLAATLLTAACQRAPEPAPFERWLAAGHQAAVDEYAGYLATAGVGDVVPMPQLLRRGRRWRQCGGAAFAVPGRADWDRMVPTLALVRELRTQGLIRKGRVVSAWRDRAFNGCEGGSRGSRHLDNNALDIEFAADAATTRRLCAFWRRRGAQFGFGLGFYAATRIHIDTAGFRTWGHDYRRGSSLCERPVARP